VSAAMIRLDTEDRPTDLDRRKPSAAHVVLQTTAYGIIVGPKRRSFARWLSLGFARRSLIRALEEETLATMVLSGRVLDIGGGRHTKYGALLRLNGTLETANIDATASPDHLCDFERPLPFEDGSFDHVLSMNTFEHIYHDVALVEEVIRVLKPAGSLHLFVPLCHRVHGAPHDYHRHTAEWWLRTLSDRGCRSIRIEPLVWSRFATAVALTTAGAYLARALAMALPDLRMAVGAARRVRRGESPSIDHARSEMVASFALGYYVTGTKSPYSGPPQSTPHS
jgi:SAM-dependent methyltransferase